jgi:TRAP-type transport system small permease protein
MKPRKSLLPPAPTVPAPLRWLGDMIDWCIVAMGGLMIVLVFFNVVSHAFAKDIAATTELCELLMVWVTFLGGAAAARRNAHMTINEFLDKLAPTSRRWADFLIVASCLFLLGLLFYYGLAITRTGLTNELTVLGIAMAWQYAALPVGAVAMAIFVAWDLWLIARNVPRETRYAIAEGL